MCQRGNCPFSNLKIQKVCKLIAFLKTLEKLKQEWQKSPALEPGLQMAKTWFGLEKQKENQPNYHCLPLLTVLPLNYFMAQSNDCYRETTELQFSTFADRWSSHRRMSAARHKFYMVWLYRSPDPVRMRQAGTGDPVLVKSKEMIGGARTCFLVQGVQKVP